MKPILSFILAFLVCITPVNTAESERPYIAVFCNPSRYALFAWEKEKYAVNYVYLPGNWEDFPKFLKKVKEQAGNRKIILDIDCHGGPNGLLYLQYQLKKTKTIYTYVTSFGFIINEINKNIPSEQLLEVESEACFAGVVYHKSIRNNKVLIHDNGNVVENCNIVPSFPIYGVRSCYNLSNSIYLRRIKYRDNIEIHDLREYEYVDPGEPQLTETCVDFLVILGYFLLHNEKLI